MCRHDRVLLVSVVAQCILALGPLLSAPEAAAAAGDAFTIVVLPDTQYYSRFYPQILAAQTQWVVDNVQSSNIVFVSHEGDVVDQAWLSSERDAAEVAMGLLDGVVRYGIAPGNHDGPELYTRYLDRFGPGRFQGYPWYGSSPDGADSYQTIEAGGERLLAIHLRYQLPSTSLSFAQQTIDQFPTYPAFITTHDYYRAGGFREPGFGQSAWDNLIRRNAQIFMVLSGHYSATARGTATNDAGLPVHEMLADYQYEALGGGGFLRLLEFDPGSQTIQVRTYSP